MIESFLIRAPQGGAPFPMNFSGISLAFAMRLLISLSATICCLPLIAHEFTGRVVGVTDGDKITLRTAEDTINVRFIGIDTPERGQPFGTESKQALSGRVFCKDVAINSSGQDRCSRTLGEIIVVGESVNLWLVRAGWAWWYECTHLMTSNCVMPSRQFSRQILAYGLILIRCRRGIGGGASVEGALVGG